MTIDEMLERMDSAEITDWAAYFAIEDEEVAKANKDNKPSHYDEKSNEDLTNSLIAAIDQAKEEESA